MSNLCKRLSVLFFVLTCYTDIFAQITYPDTQLPTDTPRLFAKDILSDGLSNRDFAISPAGDEIYFTLQQPKFISSTILRITKTNGQWGKPEVAAFSGHYRDLEASFSPDGLYIYFVSDRPITGDKSKDFDIWRVKRMSGDNWSKPENLGPTINSDKNEFYPSITKNGNLYFTVEAAYGKGSEDIVVCKLSNNTYSKPESLPEAINTKFDEFNAFVDPDEQFIIFSCYDRDDDMGRGDLYISVKNKNGDWMPAKHLSSPINSAWLDYCPFVTPDKQFLIFTSNRPGGELTNGKTKTYPQLKELLNAPGNGNDDIYWMRFNPEWLK